MSELDLRYWRGRFIQELESTKNIQVRGNLGNLDKGERCAIGVFFDVLAKDGLVDTPEVRNVPVTFNDVGEAIGFRAMPRFYQVPQGMWKLVNAVVPSSVERDIIYMNDRQYRSFHEIARYLRMVWDIPSGSQDSRYHPPPAGWEKKTYAITTASTIIPDYEAAEAALVGAAS